jgi:hypothetical protein
LEPRRPVLRGRCLKRSWALANSSSETSGRCSTSETTHSSSAPEAGGAAGLAVGGEVEPVPDQPPGVGGVLEQRPDGALGPVAAEVALYVDVGGRWRTAGAVEVIGDRLAPVAAVGPQVEDLGDDLGTLRIGDQAGLGLPGLRARGHWVRTLRRAPQPTAKTERRAPARPRERRPPDGRAPTLGRPSLPAVVTCRCPARRRPRWLASGQLRPCRRRARSRATPPRGRRAAVRSPPSRFDPSADRAAEVRPRWRGSAVPRYALRSEPVRIGSTATTAGVRDQRPQSRRSN